MSRGKTIPDEQLLDMLMSALTEHGPADLSFAKASAAAGLAAATLVQRFGTRAGMVEAILLRAWDQLDEATASADAESSPDPAGAVELLLRLTRSASGQHDFADGLLLLREDIRNPALRARGAQWGQGLAEALGRRLHPDPTRASRLGWQMVSLWQGAIIWGAFRQDADPELKMREILREWLAGATPEPPSRPPGG